MPARRKESMRQNNVNFFISFGLGHVLLITSALAGGVTAPGGDLRVVILVYKFKLLFTIIIAMCFLRLDDDTTLYLVP